MSSLWFFLSTTCLFYFGFLHLRLFKCCILAFVFLQICFFFQNFYSWLMCLYREQSRVRTCMFYSVNRCWLEKLINTSVFFSYQILFYFRTSYSMLYLSILGQVLLTPIMHLLLILFLCAQVPEKLLMCPLCNVPSS